MAKKTSPNEIKSFEERWDNDPATGLPHSGDQVQDFIVAGLRQGVIAHNERYGAAVFDPSTNTMYYFKDKEDRTLWLANNDPSLIVDDLVFNFTGTISQVKIVNKMESNNVYFTTTSDTAEIEFGFISQEKGITDSEWRDVAEDAYITVSVDKGSAGEYVEVVSNKLLLSGQTMKVDVRKFLATGGNRVMVTATGATSGTSGSLIYTATLTSMYLSPSNFAWYTPFIEGNIYNLGGVNIGGAIDKILHVKMSNEGGYEKKYELDLGTQTYITNAYFFTGLEFPTTGTGVYNVEMWLDANGLESDHLVYSIMCVSAAEQYTAKLVAISEYPQIVTNYSDNTLFKYAVYNAGASTATPHIKVTAVVDTNPIVLKDEDLKDVQTASALSYNMHLEVETEQSDLQLSAILTFGNEQVRQYAIDNSASYPATSGSVFYLNAANRSNSQANAKNIVNEATKGTVQADWVNMSWTDGIDGWTEDNNGRKCLFMPARTKATIHYQPLAVVGNGKVLEFNFKIDNVADYDEPIITICDDATSKKFRGLVITPSNILLHSRDLNSDDDVQSYDYKDEELVNVLITIIRNYKTNYGNIAQIYVNGVKKCSFEFESADSWATDSNIVIGNNTSDLYLYTMRVYDVAFGFQDAQKNYVGSLYTSKEKADAATKMNSIMDDSYNVDYDLVYGKYNTMVIEMLNGAELPHYGLSKEYSGWCNYEMGFAEHPEWNHSVSNIKIEGQGTTSMNYFRWNLRLRLDKSEGAIITYADGSMSADGALWFDGVGNHPQLNRITAKKNFASSMQSHKMGATEAYNALHHYLELDNEAGGRVAVYQYPAFGFLKTLVDGTTDQYTYTFIGFFTTGPDKGDKATFGYDNADYKSSLIHLEGTDHSIKGVGFDYPWSELKYIASEESLCVDRGSAAPEAAWEVGASGSAKTETAIQAYLNEEFKPAYNLCYENSIMIMGTDESIENINADVNAWGLRKDENGHAYQRYEFWIDGEYDLYYLSRKTGYYEKSGINLLEQCGCDENAVEGLTIEEKNQIFKDIRLAKFVAGFEDYFHKDDVLFCLAFLIIFGATDNFKKNFYPYKFGTLESGSRWRMRQDDLDTLFDIDNQGHAVKGYSIEAFDWTDDTKTAYVFKGESSALIQNTLAAFGPELKAMGKKILGAMYELSDSGTNTLDKLLGFFKKYFWNKAQDYFPKSAYNVDAEYSYEEAWPPYKKGTYVVDVNPLEQSLGDHYEAERAWVERRMIYAMSKFGYGPFVQYNDATLGQVSVRTQLAQNFTITPAMDMYPAILVGQSGVIAAEERVKAGEPVTLVGAGGENTNVYIKAADYLTDLGDLSTLTVESGNGIAISSKRLQRIKVGDENPDNVTSNLASLNVGECPSVIVVDARNLTVLSGTVDLTKCPRLDEAYFGGTDVRAINLANGSKITKLQTGDAMTQLSLMNLKFLTEENWDKGELSNVEFFRIEGCDGLNPFQLLKDMYNLEDGALSSIRVVNFTYDGDATDVDMIANLAEDKDKDGNTRAFNGIDAEGNPQPTMLPIVEGNLNIAGSVYEDTVETVRKYFPNLVLNVQGGYYIRFADDAVLDVLLAKGVGDGIGITVADAEAVTDIGTWFSKNKAIKEFNELEKFSGLSYLYGTRSNGAFYQCTSLEEVTLPNTIQEIQREAFYGCSSLSKLNLVPSIKTLGLSCFDKSTLSGVVNLPNLEGTLGDKVFGETKITKVESLGKITKLLGYYEGGTFYKCDELEEVVLPDTLTELNRFTFYMCSKLKKCNLPQSIVYLGDATFQKCTSLEMSGNLYLPNCTYVGYNQFDGAKDVSFDDVILPNLESCSSPMFAGAKIKKISNLGKLASIPDIVNSSQQMWGDKSTLEEIVLPDSITRVSRYCLAGYTNLKKVHWPTSATVIGYGAFYGAGGSWVVDLPTNIQTIEQSAFSGSKLVFDGPVILPNLSSLEKEAFRASMVEQVDDLGSITEIQDYAFYDCDLLTKATIPSAVTSIGPRAFAYCDILSEIVCEATVAPTLASNAFEGSKSLSAIYVPAASIPDYKAATNWATYESQIGPLEDYEDGGWVKFADPAVEAICVANWDTNGSGYMSENECAAVTSIDTIFQGNTEITSFDEFEKFTGVTEVPWDSLSGCTNLTSITLPKSIKTIGGRAFNSSRNLVFDIDLPDLETIDRYSPFVNTGVRRMLNLGKITIMDTWHGTDYYFVSGSSVLDVVIIPESVATINIYPFYNCPELNTIVVKADTPPSLSGALIRGTTPSPTIYVKDTSIGLYQAASNWASYTIKGLGELPTDNPTLYNEIKDYL